MATTWWTLPAGEVAQWTVGGVLATSAAPPEVTREKASLVPQDGGLTCRTCDIASFADVNEQRQHFKLDWHRYNLKRSHRGEVPISEEKFDDLVEDLPNMSASEDEEDRNDEEGDEDAVDDDDEDEQDDRGDVDKSSLWARMDAQDVAAAEEALLKDEQLRQQQLRATKSPPMIEFKTPKGQYAHVWRTVLIPGKVTLQMEPSELLSNLVGMAGDKAYRWAVILCSGGHFAASLFDRDQVVVSKTFHRYTTRRKQGGSQSANDNSKGKANSAGASIRRYNERALQQDIRELFVEWKSHLDKCNLIFMSTPSANHGIFFGGDVPVLNKDDSRIRRIPFTTYRPTGSELKRIHENLSTVRLTSESLAPEQQEKPRLAPKKVTATTTNTKVDSEDVHKPAPGSFLDALPRNERRFAVLIYAACSKGKKELLVNVLNDAGSETTKKLIDLADPESCLTPLQTVSAEGFPELVLSLLEYGADPTVCGTSGRGSKTAYSLAKDRETRNMFRRYMAAHPEKWDYAKADVPSALTEELEKEQEKKSLAREKKKLKKKAAAAAAAKKDGVASDEDDGDNTTSRPAPKASASSSAASSATKPLLLKPAALQRQPIAASSKSPQATAAAEREKRAQAAEARMRAATAGPVCSSCSKSLDGIEPYQRLTYSYCSGACVAAHRAKLEK